MPKLRPGTDEVVVIPAPPGPDAEDADVQAWIDRVQNAGIGLEGEELEAWAERVRGKAHERTKPMKQYNFLGKEVFNLSKDDLQKMMQVFLTVAAKNEGSYKFFGKNFKNRIVKDLDVAVIQKILEDRDTAVNDAVRRRLAKRSDTTLLDDTEEAANYLRLFPDQRQPVSIVAAAWGDLCKSVRQKKDWNQRQIAAVLGVRQATVSRWELGLSAPDPASRSKLIALAREIGVDHDLPAEEAKVTFIPITLGIENHIKIVALDQSAEKAIPFVPITTRGEASRAIIVQTNDLRPRYEKGDVIVVGGSFDPSEMLLRECFVVRDDGSYAFGLVRKTDNEFIVDDDRDGPPVVNAFPVLTVVRQVALAI